MSKNQKTPSAESQLKDADYVKTSQYDKTYRQVKTLNDPRFGDIHILQNPQTRQVVAVREKKVTDKAEAARQIIAARNRLALKNPYLVNLLDYSVTKQSELCSSFYIIKYYFEYPRTDLRKYSLDKEKSGQGMSSAELTHLLYQQNNALAYLQSQGTAHGDLQPLYVGWDPEKQESRLIDKSETLTNDAAIIQAQKNRLISGQTLYQSPTLYSNLKKGNTKFQFDRNKEDSFALGLLLLEAGNGHSVQNIYDAKAGQVNQGALNQNLEEFNRKFGAQNTLLVSHVSSLVNTNEAARPSPVQVQASLPPYEEVKSRLVNSEALPQGVAGFAPGINQSTRSVVQGGDLKTTITTVKEMPVVQEDLFNFDQVQAPPHQVASWDPTIAQPVKIEVPPTSYRFVPDPNRPAPAPEQPPQLYSAPNTHSLFDEPPANGNLFTTFGTNNPASANYNANARPAQQSKVVYAEPEQNWQNAESVVYGQDDFYGHQQPANFQRKVHGENVTAADPDNYPVNLNQTNQQHPQAAQVNQSTALNAQAPLISQNQQQAYSQLPAYNQQSVPNQQAAINQQSASNQQATQTFPSQANNASAANIQRPGDLIPAQMRRSVSTASQSSIQHEFRLYDSTLTQPEVISGGSSVSPVIYSQSTASNSYNIGRPLSQHSYVNKPVTYTNVTSYESPVRTSYYQVAPAQTYTTYSQSNAPAATYTTYSQSHVPATQTVSYTTSPSQLVYAQPTVVESPIQTYTTSDTNIHRVSSSQIITTTNQTIPQELPGLKYIGTYYDDRNSTVRNY